jgi:hypothetical protein
MTGNGKPSKTTCPIIRASSTGQCNTFYAVDPIALPFENRLAEPDIN